MESVRLSMAQDLASQLWEAERRNDQAMASTARLIALSLDTRLKIRVAAGVGQQALEAMTAAIGQQAVSRKLLIEAHEALDRARSTIGLSADDFGGGGDKQVPMVAKLPVRRAA